MTLKDVAKAANMSVTQVSRALNNHDDVSEETKLRIQTLANEMGYVKNITAKKLAMQETREVVLVLKGFEDPSNMVEYNSIYPMLFGANKVISEAEQELVVHIFPDSIKSYVSYCMNKGIDKAIFSGFDYDDERLKELVDSKITCVFVDIPIEGEKKGCVITNNTMYSTQAVEALLESGKENIAMISGTSHAIVSIEREAGYKIALSKKKKEAYNILSGDFDKKKAKEITVEMLNNHPEIDGFFCASDYMALGCIEGIESLGKRVPEDVGVIGFDNIPISRYTKPTLSTVAQDDIKKGYEAAKLLMKLDKGEATNKTVVLECEVIKRDSI